MSYYYEPPRWPEKLALTIATAVCLIILLQMAGCVTLTPEERKYHEAVDLENWLLCEEVLHHAGFITYTSHSHTDIRPDDSFDVRSDLRQNNCRQVLRKYWIDY